MSTYDKKYIKGIEDAKRATIIWVPWAGDWFVSHSPRNSNSNAEGSWEHWVSIALSILQHPATEVVRPEAHAAVQGVPNKHFYDESDRLLSDEEVERLFGASDEYDEEVFEEGVADIARAAPHGPVE